MDQNTKKPTLLQALVPIVFLIFFLWLNIVQYDGTAHIPLVIATLVAALMGLHLGFTWEAIEKGIINGITIAMQACLILMVIGILIGTWIISGIVPTMIAFGLKLLSPKIFLAAACLICGLVSLSTGSSWSTAGTVGIALIGVGQGLGIPLPLVAGAIVSGAYFGDKMSPLSDTTNLAPAVAGSDLFNHIRHMLWTTGPSFLIALILYTIIGFGYSPQQLETQSIELILQNLHQSFYIGWPLLLPPILVILMVVFRISALPALLIGAIVGGVFALSFQQAPLSEVISAAHYGYVSETGFEAVDSLLSRGGLESMMSTVALIIAALSFGGAMEKTGMLAVIAEAILKRAHHSGSIVASTVLSCIFLNTIAGDQYLSIIVPGRMYREAYRQAGLAPRNLSRALEDGGTLTSALIPWNSGGAYMWATLGVFPLAYLPFAFLNILNPLISIFYGFTGITMKKL